MDGYGVLFIIALVVVSGVIAYVGDVIGRRMGRRRMTIFNLRPRHTAVAVSVAAGMLIAALTLVSAMLVSRDVRDALLHAAAMRADIQALERTKRDLEQRVEASRERAASVQRRLDESQQRLHAVASDLEAQRHELTGTRQRLRQASQELQRKAAELSAQREHLQQITQRLQAVASELEDKRLQVAAQSEQLQSARTELASTREHLEQESQRLAQVERDLDKATRAAFDAGRTLINLENQSRQLQAQIQDLVQWRSRAWQTFQVIRSEPVIFGANQELLTTVIQGGRPAAQVRAELEALIGAVNQVALAGGAGAEADGRAVVVFRSVRDEVTGQPIYWGESEVLDALAQALGETQGGVVVRVASLGNVVRGETVLVGFELYHNELVFRRDQQLAQVSLDSSQDQATLLLDLVVFLRSRVSARAREAGVMARAAGRLAPNGETLFAEPDAVVGEIPVPQLLEVIHEVKSRRGPVRVFARAADDTWTAGPLRVKLEVEGRA